MQKTPSLSEIMVFYGCTNWEARELQAYIRAGKLTLDPEGNPDAQETIQDLRRITKLFRKSDSDARYKVTR